jgi:rare lipoprotein A
MKLLSRLAITAVAAFMLHGCAIMQEKPPALVAQPTPAQTARTAPPKTEKEQPKKIEIGHASWYGPGFHGKKTASGALFDSTELTAAHRELPLGSRVRVTNLENEKSVEVEINDRGPFKPGRIIDLSHQAARILGMVRDGLVKVRVELLALPDAAKF